MYDFDEIIERKHSNSVKWDMLKEVYAIADDAHILPMWVADTDFKAPPEVINALKQRLEQGVFGYSFVSNTCKEAIVSWFEKRFDWKIDANTLLFHQGVIPIIATVIEAFTNKDDAIGMLSPVYPPFFNIPTQQARAVQFLKMTEQNGDFSFNKDDLETLFQSIRLFILCHPHNPGGIVWTKDQLQIIVELAIKYDVIILSDEIHADIVFQPHQHRPLLTINRAEEAKIITAISPTKTFNIAGLQAAMMVVPNETLRATLSQFAAQHGQAGLTIFGATAVEAAYTHGAKWVDELLQYLSTNIEYSIKELQSISGIRVQKPAGTYLLWIDYRDTGLTEKEIMDKLLTIGKLALEPGSKYGEAGNGFLRMNLGCPFETVKDGIERFKNALK